jgi:Flp pilus assembly pilin Flp
MYKKLISLLKEEKGYNTVEALLWMAAVAVLSVAVTSALKERLTGGAEGKDSAVDTINETITNLLNQASDNMDNMGK